MNRSTCWLVRSTMILAIVPFIHFAGAQEKSLRPGINKPFEKPDLPEFVGKFAIESREIFA